MTPELQYLVWSVALLLVHIGIQASFSLLGLGFGYALGPQDEQRMPPGLLARRLERSLMNFIETYPGFIALALVIAVTKTGTEMTAMGAAVWFWARVAYIPVYASGIPVVRTLVWAASIAGLLMMLWPLLVG